MADFLRRDAKLSGAPKQSLKAGSKMKDTTRFRTLTSDQTSETRVPMPSSSGMNSAMGSEPCDSLGDHGGPDRSEEEEAFESEPEEADCILEDSQDSDSCRGEDEVDIPVHRHTFHETDCDAAPSICKLDHMAMLQQLLASEGWEPDLLADTGDDECGDEFLVKPMDWGFVEDTARMVVRVHPATGGLRAEEQYMEVTLEEWRRSAVGAGAPDAQQQRDDACAESGPGSEEEEPSRGWGPPQLRRIRPRGDGGDGERQEVPLLAGSFATALRWCRDSAAEVPSSSEDP